MSVVATPSNTSCGLLGESQFQRKEPAQTKRNTQVSALAELDVTTSCEEGLERAGNGEKEEAEAEEDVHILRHPRRTSTLAD